MTEPGTPTSDESDRAAGQGPPEDLDGVGIEILDERLVDEMVGKIRAAAAAPGAAEAVAAWRDRYGRERWEREGHDHAVVGETLMYLHDAPDGMLVPHARYPDGTEKIYTDFAHADALF
jgi:hypothetical protein